jgi:hypothetical protein
VSRRLRDDFDNGEHYYQYEQSALSVPGRAALNQALRRNRRRFPPDFRFRLTKAGQGGNRM